MVLDYGLLWFPGVPQIKRHIHCIQQGGRWKTKHGNWAGEGLLFHYKGIIKEAWPEFVQHRWFDFMLQEWIPHEWIGIAGPKDSSKSGSLAVIHLADYYCFPTCTTVVVSSTSYESADMRIWGEMKMRHRSAKHRHEFLPGNLIEGRRRIVTDMRDEYTEGRDFRNGCVVIPVKKGDLQRAYELIIGIKNKRKRWILEELQTLPSAALDGTANFFQTGSDTKVSGAGNPSNITDAHGKLCEPHSSLGGWDSNLDAHGKTKSWKTRFDNGVCVHLPGSDSPNMDVGPNEPVPYPFLMTRERMDKDARTWTKTDWHFQMFNEGRWPRGQGASRVITRQMCVNGGALNEAKWANNIRAKLLAMDAGFGGDRCVCHELWFGDELPVTVQAGTDLMVNQDPILNRTKQIIALIQTSIVPITGDDVKGAEDQIVIWMKKQAELRGIPASQCFVEPGMRVALVQKFTQLWSDKVVMIDFGGKPSENMVSSDLLIPCRDFYFNFVTELWYSIRLAIECGQFRQMDDETMNEGCIREYRKNVIGNKIQIETKAEFKEKSGFSPDRFDALVAGLEGAKRLGFAIKRQRPDEPDDYDNDQWKRQLEQDADRFWAAGQLVES